MVYSYNEIKETFAKYAGYCGEQHMLQDGKLVEGPLYRITSHNGDIFANDTRALFLAYKKQFKKIGPDEYEIDYV